LRAAFAGNLTRYKRQITALTGPGRTVACLETVSKNLLRRSVTAARRETVEIGAHTASLQSAVGSRNRF